MNNSIVLKTRSVNECVGVVRLNPEAEMVVRRLKAKTCQPTSYIVSEIIIQAESLISIENHEETEV